MSAPESGQASRTGRDLALLTALVLAILLPFLGKAFHVDDPLFLWAAAQIQAAPFDFFGHQVNWYGTAMSMAAVTKTPPLACYYLALAARLFGWSEPALPAAFLLPALGAAWGTYVLATRFTGRPLLAAAACVLTPAFVVSSTSLMSDTPMLCLWVWSIVFFDRGLREGRTAPLLVGGLSIAAAALTKYFAISLLPLLAVYAWLRLRRGGPWVASLLAPVALLGAYEYATWQRYGTGLLSSAMLYPSEFWSTAALDLGGAFHLQQLLAGVAFTGACTASVLTLAPCWLRRREAARLAILGGILLIGLLGSARVSPLLLGAEHWRLTYGIAAQVALWSTAGVAVLLLAIRDASRERSPESALLLLWVVGTLVFAGFVNWTVNGRSILPLAPAVGILLARRVERREPGAGRLGIAGGLLAAAAIALAAAWADAGWANSAREAARIVSERYAGQAGTVWIQGHWGFQYYAEMHGLPHMDYASSSLERDDLVVMPLRNTYVFALRDAWAERVGAFEVSVPGWISTHSPGGGAGFYTSVWGPLPFSVGRFPPELYEIWTVTRDVQLALPRAD